MNEPCDACGASGTFRAAVNGEERTLCEGCVRELDVRPASWLRAFERPRSARSNCPACGWTAAQVEQTGLVGCPLCYATLEETISRTLGIDRKGAKVS